ncbi:NAD(P)-dependent oxidoreductase [Umezawaea beigongshangensis]|uniref:NAD(P)-dependent oxidoreductase n=1 Tax=Umezawaea beigongshangensis TaxID=2780383 RepID=UPI0018F213D2|nr:NAD(P)-binding domain-containing protein [Umezawaea beigongshangensis]
MTTHDTVRVGVLGLGEMGSALATALVDAGHRTTVWNRSADRVPPLVQRGATAATTVREAVLAADLVVVCLFDAASVHEVLDPVADQLAGRTLVNVTTTSPEQAAEIGAWAAAHGAAHLDGGIMAVPAMIGHQGATVLCSGSASAFAEYRPLLDLWGESTYFGDDPGLASLYDLALLAGMYVMFAGFLHGAAMVAGAGVSAKEFAGRAAPWLSATTFAFEGLGSIVDGGDYTVGRQQSLEFSDLGHILAASSARGISTEVVAVVQNLIQRQVDAGHGREGFARIVESIKHPVG